MQPCAAPCPEVGPPCLRLRGARPAKRRQHTFEVRISCVSRTGCACLSLKMRDENDRADGPGGDFRQPVISVRNGDFRSSRRAETQFAGAAGQAGRRPACAGSERHHRTTKSQPEIVTRHVNPTATDARRGFGHRARNARRRHARNPASACRQAARRSGALRIYWQISVNSAACIMQIQIGRSAVHHSTLPRITACTQPPTQTRPSSSTHSSTRPSRPTSRPWLAL